MSEHDRTESDGVQKAPRITIREKPSEQHVREALRETCVTDKLGRRITLTRPPMLAQFRLIEVIGKEDPALASVPTYMQVVLPLIYVSAIDGDPVFFPARKVELDALIQRLDEDGVDAVVKGVIEHFGNARPEAQRTNVKN
jgi:hypothetical protein